MEGHFTLIKVKINQKNITTLNKCVLNIGAPKFIKEK